MGRLLTIATILLALLLSGCGGASMPTSGPVVDIGQITGTTADAGFAIAPRAPQPGASPAEVVQGFLDAMQATPIQTTTARQFLSTDFADAWDPQRETITYADVSPPHGSSVVTVDLQGANQIDAQGSWQGAVGAPDSQLHFTMVQEGGEWRISAAPNALIVPQSWFDDRFTQVSLYYFDPSGRTLVPEPVFVPLGTQLPTALIRALVAGPSDQLTGVVRTFLPAGVSAGLSVPVDRDGVASVDLKGDVGQQSAHALHLMTAQLAWTLRQDTSIHAIRLAVDDRPVEASASGTIPISTGGQYDPAGAATSDHLFGIADGAGVETILNPTARQTHVDPLPSELGTAQPALRSLAVDFTATEGAAVTADGHELRAALLQPGEPSHVILTGTDLLQPAWDFAGRLWDVDRTPRGAVVHVRGGAGMQTVAVPGVTGQDVRRFLVSRDGSRLIALVHRPEGDQLVASRIVSSDQGRVIGAIGSQVISDLGDGARIRDIGWHTPTSVVTLQQLSGTALIRTVSVDGAVAGFPAVTLTVGDRLRGFAASPVEGQVLFGVTSRALVNLSGNSGDIALSSPVDTFGYVG
jgi:hypothetical protein